MSSPARGRAPRELGARSVAGRRAVAAALGALHTLPFVWTGLWPLQLLVVAAFARAVRGAAPRQAAGLGLAFGSAWLGAGVWWLFISMHRYGALPAWQAALAVALLSVALAGYLAAAMAIFAWRHSPDHAVAGALLFAALWLAAELARGVLFTGFPWLASGYAHVDSPLGVLAPWIGVYGIGFVGALLAALLAFGLFPLRRAAVATLLTVIATTGALGVAGRGGWTEPAGRIGVTLIQTNVAQDEKFAADRLPAAMDWLAGAIAQARGPLVIAPETAIPLLPDQLDTAWWERLTTPFRAMPGRALLIGAPLGSESAGYTNSVLGIAAGGAADYRYDKHHLVPFGEFIPFGFRWFVDLMSIPLGDFSRGPLAAPSFGVGRQRVAPNICYEDLFGEELATRFRDPASAPTIFANLSNIGWFGDTIAVDQHLHISRMRALEFELPMLRATNTGATVLIDHRGRVAHGLQPYTRGVLDGEIEGRAGLTPYARWASRWGLWPLVVLAAFLTLLCASRRRGGVSSSERVERGSHSH